MLTAQWCVSSHALLHTHTFTGYLELTVDTLSFSDTENETYTHTFTICYLVAEGGVLMAVSAAFSPTRR